MLSGLLFCVLFTAMMSSVGGIIVAPNEVITFANCSGLLDEFLCKCLASNSTIDIQLLPGNYLLTKQASCIIQGQSSISITGATNNDTILQCSTFNIVFRNVQNVVIGNIKMVNCGDLINATVLDDSSSYTYFGERSRFAIMFLFSVDIVVHDVIMQSTLGYAFIAVNTVGRFGLERVHVMDTTFNNDDACTGYNYRSSTADFYCSGSGVLFLYYDYGDSSNGSIDVINCSFDNNMNRVPHLLYERSFANSNVVYIGNQIPLVGASCVTLYYTQMNYSVKAVLTNSTFYNNTGKVSAAVGILSAPLVMSNTAITNCIFDNNNPTESSDSVNVGGVLYISLALGLSLDQVDIPDVQFIALTVLHSNFTRSGTALHIEKHSPVSILLAIKIEHCYFVQNIANSGSVIFSKDDSTKLPFNPSLSGSLTIHLVNINAYRNSILPNSTLEHATTDLITGVFYFINCLVQLDCIGSCSFEENQPSVFYGQMSALKLAGDIIFQFNKARHGAALRLIDTVVYISTNSVITFHNNTAVVSGGAVKVQFSNFNMHTQDICPFQFVGLKHRDTITNITSDFQQVLNIDITFHDNLANNGTVLESIYANVFYICSWYPETSVQTPPSSHMSVTNNTRLSVYRSAFNYIPSNIDHHLNIISILPCLCSNSNEYDSHITGCLTGNIFNLSHKVVPGRTFAVHLIPLDTVGSIAHSNDLISSAYASGEELSLGATQYKRTFSATNKSCTYVEFSVYLNQKHMPGDGMLKLSTTELRYLEIAFAFERCPIGFILSKVRSKYACVCNEFMLGRRNEFFCDSNSGLITRLNDQSWLSVINGDIQYVEFCSPTFCSNSIRNYILQDNDVLCINNHAGRACGACKDGFSRVFGSDICKECNNIWLVTVLLYALLGIVLVVILFLLKFTVTQGVINGLIFFCNVMSINEELFFNANISGFSFVRVFISIINLDLGFEICFYDNMSQIAKTGFQFAFPLYIWLLIAAVVYLSRCSYNFHRRVSNKALPVLATLMLLSYAKILRASIRVYSYMHVQSYSDREILTWQPDPAVDYLTGGHVVLFCIASLFSLFIVPIAISFTFPRILHYKYLFYFFPLFDCFLAPYKHRCRHWFGIRLLILVYLSIMETVIPNDTESVLLSSIAVVGTFTIIQASVFPYQSNTTNYLDLAFTGIFLLLSSIVLYFHPSSHGYENVNIAVSVLGYCAFALFCVAILRHVYISNRCGRCCNAIADKFKRKYKRTEGDVEWPFAITTDEPTHPNTYGSVVTNVETDSIPEEARFQESLFDHVF